MYTYIASAFIVAVLALLAYIYHAGGLDDLRPLFAQGNYTELKFPTRQLDGSRFWSLFIYFILRTVVRRLGFLQIPPLTHATTGNGQTVYSTGGQSLSLVMPFQLTTVDLDRYAKTIASDTASPAALDLLDDDLHLLLLLSALTEPAMLLLLSKRSCPIDPVGSVNVRNRFELLDPTECRARLREALDKSPGKLFALAQLDRTVKKVKRGWEYSLIVNLRAEQETVYRQIFTMLVFAKHPDQITNSTVETNPTTPISRFRFSSSEPRLWARISKDYNPIHLSLWAAKALGFPKKIAHGNHAVTKALGTLKPTQTDKDADKRHVNYLEVEFRRPLAIPTDCEVRRAESGVAGYHEIWVKEKLITTFKYGHTDLE